MTKTEAIAILEVSKHMATSGRLYNQAIDLAIESLSADAENRHYIKIYADDEPSVKAEKLYQICGETQNREVTEWLKEYFPSADAEHDGCDGCRYEHNTEYEYPCSECKQRHMDMWEQKPNDFIEVVRCKDCKHSFYDKHYESYNCRKHEYVECFDADDYCSWGERND